MNVCLLVHLVNVFLTIDCEQKRCLWKRRENTSWLCRRPYLPPNCPPSREPSSLKRRQVCDYLCVIVYVPYLEWKQDLGGGPAVSVRALPAWGDNIPDAKKLPLLSKPLLRCLIDIKVSKVQKFIQKRLASEELQILPHQIEILYENQ
jgi:hypothetical protein